jgi:RNA polymerase sigma-70 factor (ECF subfamily)
MTTTKVTRELLTRVIAREPKAMREFVRLLEPVFRVRIAKVLLAAGDASRRDVEDLCQDTFVALLVDDGRLARLWDPASGLSFENYAGLKARHLAIDYVRKKRDVLWLDDEPCESLEPKVDSCLSPERVVVTNDFLSKVFEKLRAELSEFGRKILELLFVENREVAEVCRIMGMTAESVYAWRSRLGRRIEEIAAAMGAAE